MTRTGAALSTAAILLLAACAAPAGDQVADLDPGRACRAAQLALTLAQIAAQPFPGSEPDLELAWRLQQAQAAAEAVCGALQADPTA